MGHGHKLSCVLCQRFEETKTTGVLATKKEVTAHQNCLLFSSGIFCRESPQFHDLFGFSVEDVMGEVRRGSKLTCYRCRKKGATAGCEVKRCQKSYHYPCAVQEGAQIVEDADNGKFTLYCSKHSQERQENNSSGNGHASSFTERRTYDDPSKAGPSKKRNINGDSEAGPSVSSDSNSSGSRKNLPVKRRFSFSDKQEETPSKCKFKGFKRIILDDSSDSDENEPDADLVIFAPLESDLDESANSVPDSQLIRTDTQSPAGSAAGNHLENETKDGDKKADETDTESESLLPPVGSSIESRSLSTTSAALTSHPVSPAYPSVIVVKATEVAKSDSGGSSHEQSPVHSPDQHTAGPPAPLQPPLSPGPSEQCRLIGSPPCTSSAHSPASPELICISLLPSPAALPSDPEPSVSTRFWKSCNAAGCTQAIFADFINEMNNISSRIQSDQASREDYDLALTVMEASGKLADLVTKQQEELQRKQKELEKAVAAMEVLSGLTSSICSRDASRNQL